MLGRFDPDGWVGFNLKGGCVLPNVWDGFTLIDEYRWWVGGFSPDRYMVLGEWGLTSRGMGFHLASWVGGEVSPCWLGRFYSDWWVEITLTDRLVLP